MGFMIPFLFLLRRGYSWLPRPATGYRFGRARSAATTLSVFDFQGRNSVFYVLLPGSGRLVGLHGKNPNLNSSHSNSSISF